MKRAILAAVLLTAAMPTPASAKTGAEALSLKNANVYLADGTANVAIDKLPVCNDKVTTSCRKKNSNGIWIAVGLVALLGAVAAAGGGDSVSP